VRKITEWCLIAAGAVTLTTGCAMSRANKVTISVGNTLMAYSESVEGTPKPPPPVVTQQAQLSTPVLEVPPLATPASTPTSTAARMVAPALTSAPPSPPPAAAAPKFVSNDKLVLRGVLFEKNSSDLDDLDELILDDAVRTLKAHPNVRICVKGYSDLRGSARLNQRLSQERAASVAAYLVNNGVPLSQLVVLGMGSSHPVARNDTAAGRALNRRVELEPVVE
jgi:outer membrane protein OmpA-like peptidoglycan-associated protein